MRTCTQLFVLACCLFANLASMAQYKEKRTLTTQLANDQKGVAAATLHMAYRVSRVDEDAWFNISWERIDINAEAGFWYKGQLYKAEVPGLLELLRTAKASYPTVTFRIYHGVNLLDTRTVMIAARNDLGMFTGDQITYRTTKERLDNPAWRLEAVTMTGFNSEIGYKAEALIEKYLQEKKDKADFQTLVQEADAAYRSKDLSQAYKKYSEATRHKLANDYVRQQLEKVKTDMQKEKSAARFEETMRFGAEAERKGDYAAALRQYETAAGMGVDDARARSSANAVRNQLNRLKQEEEDRVKAEKELADKNTKDAADKMVKDREETDRQLKEQEEKMEQELAAKLAEEAKALKEEEKKKFEEGLQKQLKEQQDRYDQRQREEKEKETKEKADRNDLDNRLLNEYTRNMAWDPYYYFKHKAKGDSFYHAGMQLDPYGALELKNAWWDTNIFMADFREDLNEPRRQQAWEKSQYLLRQQETKFAVAKYSYMEAIRYTDAGSAEHKYLLEKVKQMDMLIDIQKLSLKQSKLSEEMRRETFQNAREWAKINRIRDNRVKAEMSYSRLREQYLYPNHNDKTVITKNPLQQQANFENRLNAADQQLRMDNAITGVTTQLTTSVLIDPNKTADPYGNGAMGFNAFVYSGGITVPVVANMEENPDYVMASTTANLTVMPVTAGIDWWICRSKAWDLGASVDGTFGVLPLMGYKNTFFSYSGNVKFNVGFRRIKLALEAESRKRSGNYNYDEDVALQDNQFRENTNIIRYGSFDYSVLKLGGGLHLDLSDDYEDGYLRLMAFAEKPSFYQNYSFSKPVYSFGVHWMSKGGFTMGGNYAHNYPVGGKATHMMTNYSSRDYWNFYFGKTWTLTKTH
jgi:hypothetical protein